MWVMPHYSVFMGFTHETSFLPIMCSTVSVIFHAVGKIEDSSYFFYGKNTVEVDPLAAVH